MTNEDDIKTDLNRLVLDVATEDLSTDLEIVITDGLKVMKISDGYISGNNGLILKK